MITAEDILSFKKKDMIHVDVDTTVYDALKTMVDNKIGAVVVKSEGNIVGLWTERDLMRNSLDDAFNIKTTRIGDVIESEVRRIPHDMRLKDLQENFLQFKRRHFLVEKEGKIIGLISSGDAMEAGLHYKTREMEKLNTFVSIDYYENWTRPKKKR